MVHMGTMKGKLNGAMEDTTPIGSRKSLHVMTKKKPHASSVHDEHQRRPGAIRYDDDHAAFATFGDGAGHAAAPWHDH